ncbi:phosphoribosylamine--glycine ligase [Mobilicoccus pelagius]|uniref:Phosphoribosylamine--glycine ligase n=1 Tax=Mobilicoccus pelagius NBRC 104925 TaxID=1089455 RepID=H5UUH3_9MICO|nr:phosphoribosylamine--glycine ligase [Mobilicoccus pelagius]GAB49381.1 phosphoribosylamine--glycine ligase [Mobilicoccus pelagius NBRC 104925]
MKVLVIGSGAREHALVVALSRDPQVGEVLAAPGNPGMAQLATCLEVEATDPDAVAALAVEHGVDLVVVGPEAPLVAGVSDAVAARGIPCFGPTARAARLEGSKAFAKEVMEVAGVPTARARVCTTVDAAMEALDELGAPYVVKDDGLAAGKGVVVTEERTKALAHAVQCLERPRAAGEDETRVVIEEFLDGPEISLFCLTDGRTVVPLAPAQDFKRLCDGGRGPNTGGMGAYSPLDWAPQTLTEEVVSTIAQPTVDEMRRRGTPFAGVLYVGLALTGRGLRVVEFNARFGDPETQVVLARLRTGLGGVLLAAARGELAEIPPLEWSDDAAVTVVVAARGYPEAPRKGDPVVIGEVGDAEILHAGTRQRPDGLVTAGGRVLSVVATGPDLAAARAAAYDAVDAVDIPGSRHRTDIALAAAQHRIVLPGQEQA